MTGAAAIRGFLGGPLRTATLAVAVLAVVAFAAAGGFGLSWYRAAHDGSLAQGMARDTVLQDAAQATVNLNTIDFRHVQDGVRLWEQSATGSLLEQLRANRDAVARAILDSKAITTARVPDGAVATLDERAGTAQVLVGVDVVSRTEGAQPGGAQPESAQPESSSVSCVVRRLQLDMRRDGDAWKVEKLNPVGSDNAMPGACPVPETAPSR